VLGAGLASALLVEERSSAPSASGPTAAANATTHELEFDIREYPWFRLEQQFDGQNALTGFGLRTGTFDGARTRDIAKAFKKAIPTGEQQGILPFARGPVGDIVVYGFSDTAHSELHRLSVRTGEDTLLIETPDIVHDAVWDSARHEAIYVILDRETRQPTGIFETDEQGAIADRIAEGWRLFDEQHGSLSHRLVLLDAGDRLAIISCARGRCDVRTTPLTQGARGPLTLAFKDVPDRDVFGQVGTRVWMGSVCSPPCSATSLDLRTGVKGSSGPYCETAVLIDGPLEPLFISDVTNSGMCPRTGYAVRATGVATNRSSQPYVASAPEPRLVPQAGWELPQGWFLLGTASQIPATTGQGLSVVAVRATDGKQVVLATGR
jgi:hypothetical protein